MQPVLLIVMLLIAQALASGHSVPATANLLAYFQVFLLKYVNFLVTTTPLDIKLSRCFGHGLYASACKISHAIVRHSVSEEIGPRQSKQTLKYLVDVQCLTNSIVIQITCDLSALV